MYRQMLTIRQFEEQVNDLYKTARMPGLAHLYSGEEAVAVGVCAALRRDDYITSTHRGHGHCLAKGAAIDRMFAELLGKEAGYCRGKGGSHAHRRPDTGNLGANAIVGGSAGIATGAALLQQDARQRPGGGLLLRRWRAGQGAALRGHEHGRAVEAARDLRLREQPLRRVHPLHARRTAGEHRRARRRLSASRPTRWTARTCARSTQAAQQAVERARAREGPAFLLCNTYRYYGHHVGDINRAYYRSREEEETWRRDRDPITLHGRLAARPRASRPARCSSRSTARSTPEVAAAWSSRSNAPYPDASEVDRRCLCLDRSTGAPTRPATREMTFEPGDPRGAGRGDAPRPARVHHRRRRGRGRHALQGAERAGREFGTDRVIDSPISEAGITGLGVGAAMTGMRPVVDIMFGDFLGLDHGPDRQPGGQGALHVRRQAARCRWSSARRWAPRRRSAAQHSQSLHAWVSHIPGLKVVLPSTPYDAKGLLKTAIRDDNPVVFFEDKMMYTLKGPVPEEEYTIPLRRRGHQARRRPTSRWWRPAAWSRWRWRRPSSSQRMGISAEVIDPRTTSRWTSRR